MSKAKQTLEKWIKGEYQPFLVYAAIMAVFHFLMEENPILDGPRFYAKVLDRESLGAFLLERYYGHSSRLINEGIMIYTSRNFLLWKVLDFLAWMLLAWAFSKLFDTLHDRKMNWIIVGFILLFPISEMASAGWIATLSVYIWSIAFGVYALTSVTRIYRGERIRWYQWLLMLLAVIYAANIEQMCAVLLVFFFCAFLYYLLRKKRFIFGLFLMTVIPAAELVMILTCPGNHVRTAKEIKTGIIDFAMLTKAEKLNIAFTDTMQGLLRGDRVFFAFTVVVLLLLILKYKKAGTAILGTVLVLFATSDVWFSVLFKNYPFLRDMEIDFHAETYMQKALYFREFLWIGCLLLIALSIVLLFDRYLEWFSMSLVLLMGLASRLVIGLSPSYYSSAERTRAYFLFAFIGVALYLLKKYMWLIEQKPKLDKALMVGFGAFAAWSAVNSASFIAIWGVL